jgi:hypothetical protein
MFFAESKLKGSAIALGTAAAIGLAGPAMAGTQTFINPGGTDLLSDLEERFGNTDDGVNDEQITFDGLNGGPGYRMIRVDDGNGEGPETIEKTESTAVVNNGGDDGFTDQVWSSNTTLPTRFELVESDAADQSRLFADNNKNGVFDMGTDTTIFADTANEPQTQTVTLQNTDTFYFQLSDIDTQQDWSSNNEGTGTFPGPPVPALNFTNSGDADAGRDHMVTWQLLEETSPGSGTFVQEFNNGVRSWVEAWEDRPRGEDQTGDSDFDDAIVIETSAVPTPSALGGGIALVGAIAGSGLMRRRRGSADAAA